MDQCLATLSKNVEAMKQMEAVEWDNREIERRTMQNFGELTEHQDGWDRVDRMGPSGFSWQAFVGGL